MIFYSVQYAMIGSDKPCIRWFTDLATAKAFANHNHRDKPVTHNFKNPDKIKQIYYIIDNQE